MLLSTMKIVIANHLKQIRVHRIATIVQPNLDRKAQVWISRLQLFRMCSRQPKHMHKSKHIRIDTRAT